MFNCGEFLSKQYPSTYSFKPRSFPFILKHKIEYKFSGLEKEEVIEPIQFSRWAAPIVPILKRDGMIKVCGDYKTTINQVSDIECRPLPKINELFSNLSRGK